MIDRASETAIDRLPDGDVRRLQGRDEWRLRVGEWRVVFTIKTDVKTILVLTVAPRGRAYKGR